jgi:hypothetical protein
MKAIIISLCFFAVGVGILCSGINNLMLANYAKSWPTAEGTIKSSKCVYYYVMSEGSSYFTHVNYSYTVAGKSYKGERIAFGYKGSWWRRPDQKIADCLSSAKTVLVQYDPDKPSTAVLSYGLNGSTAMTLFSGSWIMLVTAVIVLHAHRSQRKTGMLSLSWGPKRFKIIIQGVAGIVLLVVTGLVIEWIGGLLSDCGILSTLVTT